VFIPLNVDAIKKRLKLLSTFIFSKGLVCKYCHWSLYWATLLFVPSDQYFIKT